MPKYRRKRGAQAPYYSHPMMPTLPMGMPMPPMYGMPPAAPSPPIPPVPLMFPQHFMPAKPKSSPISPPAAPRKQANFRDFKQLSASTSSSLSTTPAEDFTKTSERACLPFYEDELALTRLREITDVVVIDFDQTLLGTPSINTDLVERSSRHTLEHKLGSGQGWWESRPVLESAIAQGEWNIELLETARETARNDSAALVITTVRRKSDIALIKEVLAAQGIERIDHVACSTLSEQDDDEEDADDHEDLSVPLDGWAKQVMIEVLLESYDTLERIVVFDSNRADRKKYTRAVAQFVREGWLNAEAFYIAQIAPRRVNLTSMFEERALIQKVLDSAPSMPIEKSIVTIEWLFKLTRDTKNRLSSELMEALSEEVLERLCLDDINITKGSLPPDMQLIRANRGQEFIWMLDGFKVENRTLWLRAVCQTEPAKGSVKYLRAARLAKGINDYASDRENEDSDERLRELQSRSGLRISSFCYERRQLRIQKKRS